MKYRCTSITDYGPRGYKTTFEQVPENWHTIRGPFDLQIYSTEPFADGIKVGDIVILCLVYA